MQHDSHDPAGSQEAPPALPSVSFENETLGGATDGVKLSLEQVLSTGARGIETSLGLANHESMDFERLGEVIHEAQSALVAHVMPSESGSDAVAQEREGGDGLDAEYLAAMVQTYETTGESTDLRPRGVDSFHQVSILLHAAYLNANADTDVAGRAVDAALREVDRTAAFYFIIRAVHDMASHANHEDFDRWMPAALPALRRHATPLVERLDELTCASSAHGKAALWPYAMDEILVTLKGRKQGLSSPIAELDPAEMEGALQRLAGLNAVAGRRLVGGMFALEQSFVHGVLVGLMATDGRGTLGPVLFSAFQESPPCDRGISMCMFAHRQYSPELDSLLVEQLRDTRSPVSLQAQCAAAWLLVGTIGSMPADRQGESWVSHAIEWLGERDTAQDTEPLAQATRKLLQRVATERAGLRRAWNRECRQAAKASLSRGKQR